MGGFLSDEMPSKCSFFMLDFRLECRLLDRLIRTFADAASPFGGDGFVNALLIAFCEKRQYTHLPGMIVEWMEMEGEYFDGKRVTTA
jgi:hypothetical protein